MAIVAINGFISEAQGSGRPELRFEHIPYRMSTKTVTSIIQESLGFLWVGTNSGLNRFDGVNFQIYQNTDSPHSLADNVIGALYEDSHREIWISGRSTMSRYRRLTDDFERYELPNPGGSGTMRRIRTITEDSHGVVWAAGGQHGLYYFDRSANVFRPFEPLPFGDITSVLITEECVVWATTEGNGLVRIDLRTDEYRNFVHDPDDPGSISINNTNKIVRDHDGNIWVGSQFGGVNRVNEHPDGSITFTRYMNEPGKPEVLSNNFIYSMYVDNDGVLWLGNDNGGLHRYDRENDAFHHYDSDPDDPYSLSHKSVACIHQDRSGRLWVGTSLAGLNVADRYAFKFRHYHTTSRYSHRLNNNIIRDFGEDAGGNIWVATDGGGLNYLDRGTEHFRAFEHDPEDPSSISSNAVISLSRDGQGRLWTSSYTGGLDLLADKETGRFISFEDVYGLPEKIINTPFDAHFDREHPYIWIAEWRRGVYRYNTRTGEMIRFHTSDDDSSIISNFVLHIYEDSRNDLWFASLNGLSRLASENKTAASFHNYVPDDGDSTSIPGSIIRQITEDHDGTIWITTEKGLARYHPQTDNFQIHARKHGFTHDELRSVVIDNNHNFWIGSVHGLSLFQPESGALFNFREEDGLQGNEFTPYAGFKLSTGELLFGGMNGFNLFHPDSIRINPHPPPVYIIDFKLFNESVRAGDSGSPLEANIMVTDEVRLSYRQNVITIDYIALNFTRAEQNRYAYMMEGFDADWNYVGTQRSATYTNLNPGTYRFRVKAANNDGIWNDKGTVLTLVIVPPIWQTAWFYILMGVLLILIVYFVFQARIRTIRIQNIQLERTVSQRTAELRNINQLLKSEIEEKNKVYSVLAHDLRNPFMSIIGFSEYLTEKMEETGDEESREVSSMMLKSAHNLYQLLENLLEWAGVKRKHLKPNKVAIDIHKIAEKAFDINRLPAEMKKITLENRTQPETMVLADKNMIQTVIRNLVSNAIKFSDDTSVITVGAREEPLRLIVWVTDQGVGMSAEEQQQILSVSRGYRRDGTRGEKGLGFGLMLCKDFIQQNDGELWVSSEKGKGSTFYISLKKAILE